jgi:L-lactate dehydrogenase (cytochrome)
VDTSTLPPKPKAKAKAAGEGERKIPLEEIVGIPDLDDAARRNMSDTAWAYISAGATDMYCK